MEPDGQKHVQIVEDEIGYLCLDASKNGERLLGMGEVLLDARTDLRYPAVGVDRERGGETLVRGIDELRSVDFGKVAQGSAYITSHAGWLAGVDAVDLALDGVKALPELGGTDEEGGGIGEEGGGIGEVVADDGIPSMFLGDGGPLCAQARNLLDTRTPHMIFT